MCVVLPYVGELWGSGVVTCEWRELKASFLKGNYTYWTCPLTTFKSWRLFSLLVLPQHYISYLCSPKAAHWHVTDNSFCKWIVVSGRCITKSGTTISQQLFATSKEYLAAQVFKFELWNLLLPLCSHWSWKNLIRIVVVAWMVLISSAAIKM